MPGKVSRTICDIPTFAPQPVASTVLMTVQHYRDDIQVCYQVTLRPAAFVRLMAAAFYLPQIAALA